MPTRTCPSCGAELKAEVLGGLCPKCGLDKVLAEPEGGSQKAEGRRQSTEDSEQKSGSDPPAFRPPRKEEWFDDEALWRELDLFMFPEERFTEALKQVGKAVRLAKPKGKAALDLCCGPGRCSIALAKRGFRVTGVDRTRYLLNRARAKARAAKLRIEWVLQDMRDFVRPAAFDLALSMFTSFGYFDDKAEDLTVLRNMFTSLRPGGVCLMDLTGKEVLARIARPTVSEVLPDGAILVQRHEIFDDWTRIRNEWILIRQGRTRTFKFHITIYSGQELRERLRQAGFGEVKLYGNLDGDPYGSEAQRLVAVARKPMSA